MLLIKKYKGLLIIILAGFVLAGALAGCQDTLLNQTPRGQQTVKNFFRNKSDALKATNATYAGTDQFSLLDFDFLALTDIASDDGLKGSVAGDAAYMTPIHNGDYQPDNNAFINVWTPMYKGIFKANEAITHIPDIDMNKQLRKRLVGENRFLRAYFYFLAVRLWGGVPLIKKPLTPGHFFKKRASIDSVYTFIINDLKYAASVLPVQYGSSNAGRATKGTANAYLAKVYLFRHNYDMAKKYAEKVINSHHYSLEPNYNEVFTPKGENGPGSIFEIQHKAVANGTGGGQYSQTQGVRGTPNLGFGFNMPSRNLVEAYEPGDPRMETTIMFDYEELPNGANAVRDNPNIRRYYKHRERYNQKAFVSIDIPGGVGNSGVNIRRMRYSDVLLIAAEAEASASDGNEGLARRYLNMVRKRARGGQKATVGIEVEPVSEFLADTLAASSPSSQQLENAITKKSFIRFVQSNGPAAGSKLKSFDWKLYNESSPLVVKHIDVIQSVNGNQVGNKKQYIQQMKSITPGQNVTLGIERITQTNNGSDVTTHTQTLSVTIKSVKLLPDVAASGQSLLKAIWHERRVELGMEQHRYFNLRRQGRLGERLNAVGRPDFAKRDTLYPIPLKEIELGNGKITQNPGY